MRSISLYSSEPARGWLPWGVLVPFLLILFVAVPDVAGSKVLQYFHLADAQWQPIGMLGLALFLVVPFLATGLLVLAWVHWVNGARWRRLGSHDRVASRP